MSDLDEYMMNIGPDFPGSNTLKNMVMTQTCETCHTDTKQTVRAILPITNYQMALSKQGAGGGSATHKEPT